jgi:hypothetical protein
LSGIFGTAFPRPYRAYYIVSPLNSSFGRDATLSPKARALPPGKSEIFHLTYFGRSVAIYLTPS